MFRPSLHGWPFGNAHACTGTDLGIGGPPPPELGLSGGMCWAALDRYRRGATIPRDLTQPEPDDPLHAELRQRQVAALAGLWPRIRDWQDRPDGSWRDALPIPVPFPGGDLASLTRAGWGTLRRSLDADEPVLLTVLSSADPYDRTRAVRQVLATTWSRNGLRITLGVYDPDRPNDDDVYLGFNLAGELDAKMTGGRAIRAFFPVAYDRTARPPLRTEAFDDRSVIGLKRSIRGRPAPAVGRDRIVLMARNERGALLQFRRIRGKHWEGVNVTDAEGFGAFELHSHPTAVHRMGTLHAFARSYTGDLLHFRRLRSWSVANRTDHKRAGARFRLAGRPIPVPGPRLQLSVLGRDPSGGLVHYHTAPFRGWRAEQVPGDPVADDPVAARHEDTLHVVGLGTDGRVLHWARSEVWAMTDTDAGPGPQIRLTGRPALHIAHGRIFIFGRSRDDELVTLERGDDGVWQRATLASGLAADPVCCVGPGGLHVFGPTALGGLVHAWRTDGGWTWEDVVSSRAALPVTAGGEAEIAAWGDGATLRVFVRRGPELRGYTWTPDADWVADAVTDRADDRPVVFTDAHGHPHVVLTDGRGTILHIETGAWREPEGGAQVKTRSVKTHTAATPGAGDGHAPADRDAPADAPPPRPELPPEEEVPPLPLLEPKEPVEAPAVLDFDAERRKAAPEAEPANEPEPAQPPEPVSEENASEAGETREFRWENQPPPMAPNEIEPMDLSLLDSWPPPRRSRRGGKGAQRPDNADREAS